MSEQDILFERFARERDILVQEMKDIIAARIIRGWNDADPDKRAQWRKIPCAGEVPTPEEWLRYAVKKLEEKASLE